MKHIISILLMVCACGDDRNPPAPVEGVSESDPPSTNCSAYLGCAKLCEDASCVDACAEATLAPVIACEAERCERLLAACDEGNTFACSELPKCGGYEEISTTSGMSDSWSSSSGGTSSDSSSSTSVDSGSESSSDSSGGSTSGDTGEWTESSGETGNTST